MALRKLFSKPFVLASFARGGHGWERPDVPLSPQYIDRRRHEITDIGNIWMDYTQPQYILSNPQVYMDTPDGFKNFLLYWAYFLGCVGAMAVLLKLFVTYRQPRMDDMLKQQAKQADRIWKQKLIHKYICNNPFGLQLTPDHGLGYLGYGLSQPLANELVTIKKYEKIDSEVKAYIHKKILEAESELQLLSPKHADHKQQTQHSQSH